jgi:ABC-type branched-subunit amino acid transport system ATPase component
MEEEQIKKLRETGLTVLLAEQNVRSALRLGDRGYRSRFLIVMFSQELTFG